MAVRLTQSPHHAQRKWRGPARSCSNADMHSMQWPLHGLGLLYSWRCILL